MGGCLVGWWVDLVGGGKYGRMCFKVLTEPNLFVFSFTQVAMEIAFSGFPLNLCPSKSISPRLIFIASPQIPFIGPAVKFTSLPLFPRPD